MYLKRPLFLNLFALFYFGSDLCSGEAVHDTCKLRGIPVPFFCLGFIWLSPEVEVLSRVPRPPISICVPFITSPSCLEFFQSDKLSQLPPTTPSFSLCPDKPFFCGIPSSPFFASFGLLSSLQTVFCFPRHLEKHIQRLRLQYISPNYLYPSKKISVYLG